MSILRQWIPRPLIGAFAAAKDYAADWWYRARKTVFSPVVRALSYRRHRIWYKRSGLVISSLILVGGLYFHTVVARADTVLSRYKQSHERLQQIQAQLFTTTAAMNTLSNNSLDEAADQLDVLAQAASAQGTNLPSEFVARYALRRQPREIRVAIPQLYEPNAHFQSQQLAETASAVSRIASTAATYIATPPLSENMQQYVSLLDTSIKEVEAADASDSIDARVVVTILRYTRDAAQDYESTKNLETYLARHSNLSSELSKEISRMWTTSATIATQTNTLQTRLQVLKTILGLPTE